MTLLQNINIRIRIYIIILKKLDQCVGDEDDYMNAF